MEEKIILDKETFKALSQDNRINILKLLSERNHTLSEIAEKLSYSNSTVKEHLEVMVNAGLIKQIDSGHKWKYYKLTFKGRNVVDPREVKVLFAFAVSTMAVISAGLYMLKPLLSKTMNVFSKSSGQFDEVATEAAPIAVRLMAEAPPQSIDQASILNISLIILLISLFAAGIALGYLIKRKRIIITNNTDEKKVN